MYYLAVETDLNMQTHITKNMYYLAAETDGNRQMHRTKNIHILFGSRNRHT